MPAKKTTTRKTTTAKKAPAKKAEPKAEEIKAENLSVGVLDTEQISGNENVPAVSIASESVAVENFESAEIAALKEELAKAREELAKARTSPTDDEGHPVPEEELTDDQRQIRALQDELARTRGKDLDSAKEEEEDFDGEEIVIHILKDGFSAMGRIFYRGQEVVFGPKAYEDTKDRFGRSWLTLSEDEQYSRWGSAMFGRGEWPGRKTYEDTDKSIRVVAPVIKY